MQTANANPTEKCPHCTMIHQGACPMVKSIEYYPDGSIKRVEFKTIADNYVPNTYWTPWGQQPWLATSWVSSEDLRKIPQYGVLSE